MRTLTPAERRAHRAAAHHLHPVVAIGQHGLTAAVLKAVDVALSAHELVKVRVFSDERDEREALLARICESVDAAPVQHLGKILTVWRPAPPPPPAPPGAPERARRPASAAARSRAPGAGPGKGSAAKRPAPAPQGGTGFPARKPRAASPAGGARGPVPGARRRRRSV